MKASHLSLAQYAGTLGVELATGQLAAFDRLGEELVRWNRQSNLTAITNPDDIIIKHFIDSLTLAPLLSGQERLLDVGSGAGFPAIPLKIALPELKVVTVDAVQKKIFFQRHMIRTLGLTGITAQHDRIENIMPQHNEGFDVIVSRAFTALADFVKLVTPLLSPMGRIIAMKGKEGRAEAAQLDFAALGVLLIDINELSLPMGAGERSLIVMKKVC
jgi:16S rRNA (guanine527-N7)-methyltransferase